MMDYERLFINKMAQMSNVEVALSCGVREDHFEVESHKLIFAFMVEHFRRYKIAPSLDTVKAKFPEHLFEISGESLEYLRDEFLKLIKRRHAMVAVRDLAESIDDPDLVGDIDALFLEKSRELAQLVPTASLSKFSNMEERIENYELGLNETMGIEMGIPDFDFITSGIQPHEYVSIVGWQGTGKSTLAQWMLFNAYMQGKTPMLISLEMESKALFRKWDTMLMQFEYQKLKRGRLDEKDLARWKEKASEIKNRANDIIVMDDVKGCTVDRIYAELTRFTPDLVCIDYISLMDTHRSAGAAMWEKVTYLTQALKQTSRTLKIPIIGVAQTNINSASDGASLETISYSRSIGQDSDIVIGLYNNEEMKAEKRMEVRLLKNRDGQTKNTQLLWNMEKMDFRPWRDAYAFMDKKIEGEI